MPRTFYLVGYSLALDLTYLRVEINLISSAKKVSTQRINDFGMQTQTKKHTFINTIYILIVFVFQKGHKGIDTIEIVTTILF